MKYFNPAFSYNPAHHHWDWDSHKVGMSNADVVGKLWHDYNTMPEVPISRIEHFLQDVQRISSACDTRDGFHSAMRSYRSGRYGVLSDRLKTILQTIVTTTSAMPDGLLGLCTGFRKTPSLDILCEIFEFLHRFSWEAQPPPRQMTPELRVPPEDQWCDWWADTQDPYEASGLPPDFEPGFSDNRRVDELDIAEITQPSHGQPSKQPGSANHGAQSSSSACNTNLSTISSTDQPTASSAPTIPHDATQQPANSPSRKRSRDESMAEERPDNVKRRKTAMTPQLPVKPPAKKRTHAGDKKDGRPDVTKGSNAAGTRQKPAEPPSRKQMRDDEDDTDGRLGDSKRGRATRASQPPIPEPAPRQSAQSQHLPNDDQPNHGSAPSQSSQPTLPAQDSVAPAATRRQTRSAKAATALLELDGSGRSARQSSRASRARGKDGKEPPPDKVAKAPARGSASVASQTRPQRKQEIRKSQRASARR